MSRFASDLHIHSCLSPCGDELMTPNNIVNMAKLKGLDMIAVSDHNSALNLPPIKAIADSLDILLIPAIEAESVEEVHVLCYMPSVAVALELSAALNEALPNVKNKPKFFGEQNILDENDEFIGTFDKLLIQSTMLSIDKLCTLVRNLGGVTVPAHINRTSNSILINMGFIPSSLNFSTVEIYNGLPISIDVSMYHTLFSSDAHNLDSILERESFIDLPERSVNAFLKKIGEKR
ncbi:MAG: histidinol-phosphatase [Clostridia bacterium]